MSFSVKLSVELENRVSGAQHRVASPSGLFLQKQLCSLAVSAIL